MACTFGPSITRNLIRHVLAICQVKLMQSTGLEQHFGLQSLLPALRNLWLVLVHVTSNIYILQPQLPMPPSAATYGKSYRNPCIMLQIRELLH